MATIPVMELEDVKEAARETLRYPDDPVVWIQLGRLLEQHGDLAKAHDCYMKAFHIAPDDIDAVRMLKHIGIEMADQARQARRGGQIQSTQSRWSFLKRPISPQWSIVISLATFLIIFGMCAIGQWTLGDLLWGLWLSSLVFGLGYVFVSVAVYSFSINDISVETEFWVFFFFWHILLFLYINSFTLLTQHPLLPQSAAGIPQYIWDWITPVVRSYWPVPIITVLTYPAHLHDTFRSKGDLSNLYLPWKNLICLMLTIFLMDLFRKSGAHSFLIYIVLLINLVPYRSIGQLYLDLKSTWK
jgi:hypothetical protein